MAAKIGDRAVPGVLFVHNGAPGRFASIAGALRERGWTGALINGPTGTSLQGYHTVRWGISEERKGSSRRLVRQTEAQLVAGAGAAHAALDLRRNDFTPDLIIGHPSWGEMLFLREVFPTARQIQLAEFYYQTAGANFGFDPEFAPHTFEAALNQQAGNAAFALSCAQADRLVAPTEFQASTYPAVFRPLMTVAHEGVDTRLARAAPGAPLHLRSGVTIAPSVPLVTFVIRRFEPLRGFHVFMRALPRFLAEMPNAQVLIVGTDDPETYGPPPPEGSWRTRLLAELGDRLDASRVHWVGLLPYDRLLRVFSSSWAHVYLSYPFVLSWSLLDAMATGCLVIASDTASVREVVEHGHNGLLVPFFDAEALVATLVEVCRRPEGFCDWRAAARATILRRYDRHVVCLPRWLDVVDRVMGVRG